MSRADLLAALNETILWVDENGMTLGKALGRVGALECPFRSLGKPGEEYWACGNKCPHFEVEFSEDEDEDEDFKGDLLRADVTIWCSGNAVNFENLRVCGPKEGVVEPEGKGEGTKPEGTAGT